ncbi:membrane protein [Streptococcus pneumoniae]|nr:membrane protein [Streptococcus pneumoniae]
MTPAGLFWGLFSALTYALYIILPIALIKKWGSSLVIGVGMVIAGLVALPFTGVLQADIPTSLDFLLAFGLQALSLSGLSLPIQLSLKEPV